MSEAPGLLDVYEATGEAEWVRGNDVQALVFDFVGQESAEGIAPVAVAPSVPVPPPFTLAQAAPITARVPNATVRSRPSTCPSPFPFGPGLVPGWRYLRVGAGRGIRLGSRYGLSPRM